MMEDTHPPESCRCAKSDSPLNPVRFRTLFLISFVLILATTALPTAATITEKTPTLITSSNFLTYYTKHCSDFVPESPVSPNLASVGKEESEVLHFDIANVTGGKQLLPASHVGSRSQSVSLLFRPKRYSISRTEDPSVLNLHASLGFHLAFQTNYTWGRNLKQIRFRAPRIPIKPRSLVFGLYGFWSMRTGKLCMVGSGSSKANFVGVSGLNVVLKLNYPVNFSEVGNLITGVLESLADDEGSLGYFEPVSILAIPHLGKFKYTLIDGKNGSACASGHDEGNGGTNENPPLQFMDSNTCIAQLYRYTRNFKLDYGSECGRDDGKCNPLGEGFGVLPRFMGIQGIRCERGAVRVLIVFSESGYFGYGPLSFGRIFDPSSMLIGEGMWDEKKNSLCMVACHFLNSKSSSSNVSVGDCSIRFSMRFPRILNIRRRNMVAGQISSDKTVNETGYLRKLEFHGAENSPRAFPGLKYEYTLLDRVNSSCSKKKIMKGNGKAYPNGFSSDMKFYMSVRNGEGQTANGFSVPQFVGDQLYEPYRLRNNNSGLLKISYKMRFTVVPNFRVGAKLLSNVSVEIAAEGMYDSETGVLCMIGCWSEVSSIHASMRNDSVDCDVLVNAQFSPLNSKGEVTLKGTIESTREKSDPLYFGQLEVSSNSMYKSQAAESIWRMDVEITLVLISNTLACVFVGFQLYHVKKHPDVLPFISFLMLAILTLGHMIPLLLNFEAVFVAQRNRQNIFLESGGWLEVNEVAVRVVTMVAFLLEFRLLQLTWSARKTAGSHESLWLSEKKTLYVSLPFYISGGMIAWYAHQPRSKRSLHYLLSHHMGYLQNYPWRDLKSYAGLIVDSFLLPQIIFNLLSNSTGHTLTFAFYFGTTAVRVLPHAYDLYRAHSSTSYLDFSYIYANHVQDFYSTAWDIVIPLCGLLFASIIYLQQQFGGQCFVPKRFRRSAEYEKIPVVTDKELQPASIH